MHSKKGLSTMELVVTVIVLLVVLVVVLNIFTGGVKSFLTKVGLVSQQSEDVANNCRLNGGSCVDVKTCEEKGYTLPPATKWNDCSNVCCKVAN